MVKDLFVLSDIWWHLKPSDDKLISHRFKPYIFAVEFKIYVKPKMIRQWKEESYFQYCMCWQRQVPSHRDRVLPASMRLPALWLRISIRPPNCVMPSEPYSVWSAVSRRMASSCDVKLRKWLCNTKITPPVPSGVAYGHVH